MKKFEACAQAIHFLLKSFEEMDKLKIAKLVYLADKYHLIASRRTITGDNYLAMRHGPVGNMVLSILNRNTEYLEPAQLDFINQHIQQIELNRDDYKCTAADMDYDQLSESDKKALIKIGNIFGAMDKWDLVNLTHKYPEWVQYERELEEDPSISKSIPLEDMFSKIENDPLGLSAESVKVSRAFFLGLEDELEDDESAD
ncbi:MAG: SocA family protein [Chitinispirillales bacterium]|jgi:uncharacterized phage-associated protein|nr:SocA family protein [Chitinispirillales bacterium]